MIKNTIEQEIAEQAIGILDADKKEVDNMVANITRTIEEMKQEERREAMRERDLELARALLDALDDHTIALKTGLPLEEIQELRKKYMN